MTKRMMLSKVSEIFDPLGVASPVTIRGRILLQDVCKTQNKWDETLNSEVEKRYAPWIKELEEVKQIVFSRSLHLTVEDRVECRWLHGFADASKHAYCACVYMVTKQSTGTFSSLITAKTRVAPIKETSIPKLELMAARILATLISTVKEALGLKAVSTYLWSDSYTTLCWIANRHEWKQFVTMRVNEILCKTKGAEWRYCPTESNSADLGSRGISANKLQGDQLCWHGPDWIREGKDNWPENIASKKTTESEKEEKKAVALMTVNDTEQEVGIEQIIDINI